jgi:activator of HSP90 ATPase
MAMNFEIDVYINASPSEVYKSWLDGSLHTQMTGGSATGKPEVGFQFTAWDGYISGMNVELESDKRILQSWRTTEFDENDADSILELVLEPEGSGCKLTLTHSDIPDGQPDYKQGWYDHYFTPMKSYFAK